MEETAKEEENAEKDFKKVLSDISASAISRFLAILIGSSIITLVVNISVLNYYLSELTDQLDNRIEQTNDALLTYKRDSDRLRSEAVAVATGHATSLTEIRERLARIEAQSELSSSILIGVRDGDSRPPRLEDQLPDIEEVLSELVPIMNEEPMGGGGTGALAYGYPPARKILPFDVTLERLEREKQLLIQNYTRALTGGFGPQIDLSTQEVEVRHGAFYNGNDDEIVVVLIAFVVAKE